MDIKGKTVVLTGDFKFMKRAEASDKLAKLGAKMAGDKAFNAPRCRAPTRSARQRFA